VSTAILTPVGDLPAWVVIVANVGGWMAWMLAVGWWANRVPLGRLERDTWVTRPRRFEQDGRWYERTLRIRRWKDRLPEGGAFYAGGFAKRSIRAGDPDVMQRFVAETRRAEYAHWVMFAGFPVFFLWNAWWGDLLILGFAVVVNLPCLLVQRYNRARLSRVIRARGQR